MAIGSKGGSVDSNASRGIFLSVYLTGYCYFFISTLAIIQLTSYIVMKKGKDFYGFISYIKRLFQQD